MAPWRREFYKPEHSMHIHHWNRQDAITVGQNKAKCSQPDSTAHPAITYPKTESRMFVLKLSWEVQAQSPIDKSADLSQDFILFTQHSLKEKKRNKINYFKQGGECCGFPPMASMLCCLLLCFMRVSTGYTNQCNQKQK